MNSQFRWLISFNLWLFVLSLVAHYEVVCCSRRRHEGDVMPISEANIHVDSKMDDQISNYTAKGEYDKNSILIGVYGSLLVWKDHITSNTSQACSNHYMQSVSLPKQWIALIIEGSCSIQERVVNMKSLPSHPVAVIVLKGNNDNNHESFSEHLHQMVQVGVSFHVSQDLLKLSNGNSLKDGRYPYVHISIAHGNESFPPISRTSVLFVSISFIVLMIISLAWLVFYYIQRYRYAHAKERLMRRLMNAARKAITKIPMRTIKADDGDYLDECETCAICIENYQVHDVIRTLPCSHFFHKSCVDPWLIEQRSCPICKSDILKAYGLKVVGLPIASSESNSGLEAAVELIHSSGSSDGLSVSVPLGMMVHMPESGRLATAEVVPNNSAARETHEMMALMNLNHRNRNDSISS